MATVKIYSTPSCPYCTMVKDYLTKKNVAFVDYDVSQDQAKAQEMVNLSGQMGVPVVSIDGQSIVGFDRPRIDAALNLT